MALGESAPSPGALAGLGKGTSRKVPETLLAQRQDAQTPGRPESQTAPVNRLRTPGPAVSPPPTPARVLAA